MSGSRPILCLDFDGVLHAYTSGWQGVTNIPDGPVPGAAQFIADAQQHFDVQVYSSRSASTNGITAMSAHLLGWLKEGLGGERGYEVWQRVVFPTYKPAAMVGIDDRVITFNGTWPNPADLRHFKPWNKRLNGELDPEVQQRADILLALEAALVLLGRNEPGDSRAVSDQFVAMGAALAGSMNVEGRLILQEILLSGKGYKERTNEAYGKVGEHKSSVVFADPHARDPQQSGG